MPRVSVCVCHVFWIKRILLFSLFLDTFSCSKDFAVSLFQDTFCVQRILLFPCFWTLSVFKGFWRFPVSRHLNFSKVSGNRKNNQILWENHYCQGILSFLLFIDSRHFWLQKKMPRNMRNNNIPWKKMACSRDFVVSPVSRHFNCIQKCPERGKQQNPLTFSISSNSCTIRPSRAPQARGKAWEVYPL